MLLYGDATPSEAAFGARTVPGGGVGEGCTSVGESLRAPMIRVPNQGCGRCCMASCQLLHTKGAERGFSEGARGHNSLARRCGEVPDPRSSFSHSSLRPFLHRAHKTLRESKRHASRQREISFKRVKRIIIRLKKNHKPVVEVVFWVIACFRFRTQ